MFRKLSVILVIGLLAFTAACSSKSSTSTNAASATGVAASAAATSTPAACPTKNTESFAKTKFVADVAIAGGAFKRYIYTPAKDGKFKWWEPASGNVPGEAGISMGCSWSIAPFSDGRRMLFTDENAAVVWDFRTRRTVLRLDRHTAQVVSVAVSADCRRAVTGSQDRTVRIWNVP